MLYSKQAVYFTRKEIYRRIQRGDGLTTTGLNAAQIAILKANFAKDLNIDDRVTTFKEELKNEYVYRVSLRYFTDLGKINFPVKIDFRIKCHLETEMKKLFEFRKVLASGSAIPAPNAKNNLYKSTIRPILLDKNFRQYLETIMVSKKILRMGAQ